MSHRSRAIINAQGIKTKPIEVQEPDRAVKLLEFLVYVFMERENNWVNVLSNHLLAEIEKASRLPHTRQTCYQQMRITFDPEIPTDVLASKLISTEDDRWRFVSRGWLIASFVRA